MWACACVAVVVPRVYILHSTCGHRGGRGGQFFAEGGALSEHFACTGARIVRRLCIILRLDYTAGKVHLVWAAAHLPALSLHVWCGVVVEFASRLTSVNPL